MAWSCFNRLVGLPFMCFCLVISCSRQGVNSADSLTSMAHACPLPVLTALRDYLPAGLVAHDASDREVIEGASAAVVAGLSDNRLDLANKQINDHCARFLADALILDGGTIPCPETTPNCSPRTRHVIHSIDLSYNALDAEGVRVFLRLLQVRRSGAGQRLYGRAVRRLIVTGNSLLSASEVNALRHEFASLVGNWQLFGNVELVFDASDNEE